MRSYYTTLSDRIFMVVVGILLGVITLSILYPLIYIISSSFSSSHAVMSGRVWLYPVEFSLKGYQAVFENAQVWTGYYNSLINTVCSTVLSLVYTLMLAYPLSKKDFGAKGPITLMMTIIMFFGGGMIPSYLLINNLGLMNTRWAIIIPPAVHVWYIIMCRTYIQHSIPASLTEAATLDGCDDFNALLRIIIPLSKPILAVITLYVAVSMWNSYFSAMLYLRKQSLYPLQIVLRNILILNQFDPNLFLKLSEQELIERQNLQALLKFSLIIMASVPVMLLYPFVQKHFVKGIMVGSIKG